MHLMKNIFFLSGVILSFLFGFVHTYKISEDSGSGRSHSVRRAEHSEECVRGPDGKDPPLISTNQNWIHTGKKSTITLKCHVCADKPYKVWWTKDNQNIRSTSGSRIRTSSDQKRSKSRQHHHRKPSHLYKLKIKAFRESDFGLYRCNIFDNKTRMQEEQEIQVSGVPYPAVFETPTTWSETEFVLSWKLNCSIWAPPIIDYQLEFRQSDIPRARWIKVNVPAHDSHDDINPSTNLMKEGDEWSHNPYTGNGVNTDIEHGLHQKRSRIYRGLNAPKLTQFRQSYALRGLSRATNYECRVRSRNEHGFSAYSDILYFRTFDFAHKKGKDGFQNTFLKTNEFNDNIFLDTSTENERDNSNIGGFTREADLPNIGRKIYTKIEDDTNSVVRKPLATRRSQGYTGYSTASRTHTQLSFTFQTSSSFIILFISMIISILP